MSQIRKALALTFLSTNGATAVLFGVTLVLARLLSPEQIGIFSITAVAVSIAQLFRDFGVASYLQHEAELTRAKVATAFGVLLASSWMIAVLVYLTSGPLARFYGEPGVQDVMQVLALGFVFIPFGAVTHNLLTRDYRLLLSSERSGLGGLSFEAFLALPLQLVLDLGVVDAVSFDLGQLHDLVLRLLHELLEVLARLLGIVALTVQ